MNEKSTIDAQEIARFSTLSHHWWDTNGALKTLHDINPVRLDFIRRFIDPAGQRLLDVGCGGGILTEALAKCGAEMTGLDAEADAIASAVAHAEKDKVTISYRVSPVEDLDGLPFDGITCMEMLEHVEDPQLVINHCARLLKPGGWLFLSTINRSAAAYAGAIIAAEYLLGLIPRQTHEYSRFIKPSELANAVRAAGLEVLGLQGLSYNPVKRTASLQDSVAINYLMACRKEL